MRERGKTYPNGVSKSRLLEVFLSFRDFGCHPDEYLTDIAQSRKAEAEGVPNCHWCSDEHGRLIVDDIIIHNRSSLILITDSWFKIVPSSLRVFISYAKEDNTYARRLFSELKNFGAQPWLDEEHLLPGQRWEAVIEEQIALSDYFIALLSSRSVSKKGYVQRELRQALYVFDSCPEGRIYLIPARIDECSPTHRALLSVQWVDLFPSWDAGVQKILQSLHLSGGY